MKYVKIIRIAAASLFFALYLLLFLGALDAAVHLADFLPKLQIFPGLLKLAAAPSRPAVLVLLLLVLTAVFGRWYCSILCPFGVLQDLFIALSRKLFRHRRFRFRSGLFPVHLTVFVISMGTFAAGFSAFVLHLEPYSAFGRIALSLVRSAAAPAVNALSYASGRSGVLTINPIKEYDPGAAAVIYAAGVLICIGAASMLRGRLFCSALCPTGLILRLCARLPFLRFRIDPEKCVRCGRCESVCRAECADAKHAAIDVSRCVSCAECMAVCPELAIVYGMPRRAAQNVQDDSPEGTRSAFLRSAAGAVVVLPAFTASPLMASVYSRFLPFRKKEPVMPPGAASRERFTSRCTACGLCIEACPDQIIRPSTAEYGITSFLQPRLDFDKGYCLYECTRCTEVCPTGALTHLKKEEKGKTQMGKAVLLKEHCIVYEKELACTACTEHCPTKAVDGFPYKNGLMAPEVETSACVGCGACEHVCPVRPKAIYVEGNIVQTTAQKKSKFPPKEGKTSSGKGGGDDFPF